MSCRHSCENVGNTCLELFISLVLAVAVGVLFAYALIPGIVTGIWIVFGLAVLNLILLIVGLYTASIFRRSSLGRCLFCKGQIFLAGIIGTILLALVLLSIQTFIVPTSILIAAIVAIGAFFAALMGVELVVFLTCLIKRLRD